MKLVIFAGGMGTRLWPLSRVNLPKQFDKIFNGQSTLQLTIKRIAPVFGMENIFIQTIEDYKEIIKKQLLKFPEENILIEPARRDLGAAVCFTVLEMQKRGATGPIALLWADHLIEKVEEFTGALKEAEKLIKEDPERFIFLAEKPRFANNNIGWIKLGEECGVCGNFGAHNFAGWKYRPPQEECEEMFNAGDSCWNPGYFITSIEFLSACYKNLAPDIYEKVSSGLYEEAPAKHFDEAIIEKLDLSNAMVLKTDMGWSDPGTLYALKEALEKNQKENVIHGRVAVYNTEDSLLYNMESGKILTAVGLKGMVVVNMDDALLIAPKEEVVHISKLVKKMKEEGLSEFL